MKASTRAELQKPLGWVMTHTPFTSNDEQDDEALRQHFLHMAGVPGLGLIPAGPGIGQGQVLTEAETLRQYKMAVEVCRGRAPVVAASYEVRSARQMVRLGELAVSAGCDAWQVYSLDGGHGMVPRPEELEQYFRDCLSSVDLPAFLSSHFCVGYQIPVHVVKRLVDDYDKVVGLMVTTDDVRYLAEIHEAVGKPVAVYTGGSFFTMMNLLLGGQGFLDLMPNIAPRLSISVVRHYRSGNIARAVEAWKTVGRLDDIIHGGKFRLLGRNMASQLGEASPPMGTAIVKAAMNVLGLPGGHLRKPYLEPDEAYLKRLALNLKDFDLRAIEAAAEH